MIFQTFHSLIIFLWNSDLMWKILFFSPNEIQAIINRFVSSKATYRVASLYSLMHFDQKLLFSNNKEKKLMNKKRQTTVEMRC